MQIKPLVFNIVTSGLLYPLKNQIQERLLGFFSESDKRTLRTHFSGLEDPVQLIFVKRDTLCRYCRDTCELVMEFAEISKKIRVDVYDIDKDADEIGKLGIERVPAIALLDKSRKDTGIRFYGMPGGYEFHSLLGAVLVVSKRRTGLTEDLIRQIKRIETPLHIKTYITPTCPYCSSVVRLIHKMAFLNPHIRADMIEVTEFPELGNEAGVKGVPKTIVNHFFDLEGALPEEQFIYTIIQNLKK